VSREPVPGGTRPQPATGPDADTTAAAWRRRAAALLPPLVVAVVTAAAFRNAAPDALVLDDLVYVPAVERCSLAGLFTEIPWAPLGLGGPYRPLSMGSICLESGTLAQRPSGHHRVNVNLHVLTTVLLYALALVLLGTLRPGDSVGTRRLAAAGAALVFGLHPVHTEAIDAIFNRSEILATAVVLAGLLFFAHRLDRSPVAAWSGLAVAYLLALLCKESGASLPLVVVLWIAVRERAGGLRAIVRRALPVVSLALPLAIYLVLRERALATVGSTIPLAALHEETPTLARRLALAISTVADGLRLMVWPWPLRASYDVYEPHAVVWSALALTTLAVAAIVLWRRIPALGFGLFAFVGALVVSSRLVTDPTVAGFAERFLYLPSAGLALALAVGLAAAMARVGALPVVVSVGMVVALLGTLTWQRNWDWRDDVALWEHDVAVAPANGVAWMQLTTKLLNRGDAARVVALCGEHLPDVQPENGQFLNNCGLAAKSLERFDEAERMFRRAIAIGEGTNVYANLGGLLARQGRLAEAEQVFEEAMARETSEAMRQVRRGQMLVIVHPERVAEARAAFEEALRIQPGFKPAESWLARLR
jgi:tetratricopeptide (TPR) repeat protein